MLGREFGYNSDTARAKAMKYSALFSPSKDAMHVTGTANTLSLGKPASKQQSGTKGAGEQHTSNVSLVQHEVSKQGRQTGGYNKEKQEK